jgi:hypothetical protein
LEEPGKDEKVHPDIRAVDQQGDADVWQKDVVGIFKREITVSERAPVLFGEPGGGVFEETPAVACHGDDTKQGDEDEFVFSPSGRMCGGYTGN